MLLCFTHVVAGFLCLLQLLIEETFFSGNSSRWHHRDCCEWDYWFISPCWKRWGHSPRKKYSQTCHSCWEEAYNGEERIWEGKRNVFRTSHGTQNCCSAEGSVAEVQGPSSSVTFIIPPFCLLMQELGVVFHQDASWGYSVKDQLNMVSN